MIVNTASKCGFTPQYAELQHIYEQYKYKDFVIVGFPSNDFGNQEPGSNEDISEFCQQNYGMEFPMMAKIKVKGDEKHPLYQFLTEKAKNGFKDSEVKWNFQKYLIDQNGKPWLIDPAVYYGHREADLAMTSLFGGFSKTFYSAYESAFPLVPGYPEREPLYQLYHLLNHLNLFGTGYYRQVISILKRYAG